VTKKLNEVYASQNSKLDSELGTMQSRYIQGTMVNRGQIWWAELPEPKASGPGYRRPVIVVQTDAFNN